MSKNYLKYLIINNKNQMIFLSFILFVIMPVRVFTNQSLVTDITMDGYLVIYLASFILVSLNLSFLHKKRASDTYYQLPLEKEKIYLTKVIFVILEIALSFLLAVFLSIVLSGFQVAEMVDGQMEVIPYLSQIIVGLILIVVSVFINSFFYQIANSEFDANVFLLMMLANSFVITYCFGLFVSSNSFDSFFLSRVFNLNILSNAIGYLSSISSELSMESTIFYTIVISGVIMFIISYFQVKNRPGEATEQISNSKLGYPLIKYLGVISCLFVVFSYNNDITILTIGLIFTYIMFIAADILYKRKIVLSKMTSLIFIFLVLAMFGFKSIFIKLEAFGLDKYYYQNYQEIEVDLYSVSHSDSILENGFIAYENVDEGQLERAYTLARADFYQNIKDSSNQDGDIFNLFSQSGNYEMSIIYRNSYKNKKHKVYKSFYFNNIEEVKEVLDGKNSQNFK